MNPSTPNNKDAKVLSTPKAPAIARINPLSFASPRPRRSLLDVEATAFDEPGQPSALSEQEPAGDDEPASAGAEEEEQEIPTGNDEEKERNPTLVRTWTRVELEAALADLSLPLSLPNMGCRVLAICPTGYDVVEDLLKEMVHCGYSSFAGSYESVHITDRSILTASDIKQMVKVPSYDLIICFGLPTLTLEENMRCWLAEWSELVGAHEGRRGIIFAQLARATGEAWPSVLARYRRMGKAQNVRLDRVNGVDAPDAMNKQRMALLHSNLAHRLEYMFKRQAWVALPSVERLRSKARTMNVREPTRIIQRDDFIYGQFLPGSGPGL